MEIATTNLELIWSQILGLKLRIVNKKIKNL